MMKWSRHRVWFNWRGAPCNCRSFVMNRKRRRPSSFSVLPLSVSYAAVAAAWIVGSSMILDAATGADHELHTMLEQVKGLAFIVVSAVVLHLLVRRHTRRLQAAQAETARIAQFAELSPHPIVEFDPSGEVVGGNAALRRTTLATGLPLEKILPERTDAVVAACLQFGTHQDDVLHSYGGRHWRWSFFPVSSPRGVYAYGTDWTDEANLRMNLEHTARMESVGQLAAGTAHDINNVMTALNGHCGILRQLVPERHPYREEIDGIHVQIGRAAELAKQLMSVSRTPLPNGKVQMTDLSQASRGIAETMRRMLPPGVALRDIIARAPLYAYVDVQELERAMLNLAANAIDAIDGKGGNVMLIVREEGGDVCITVRDSGQGIPPDVLPRIFDPFFTTKGEGRGTGLGLASVHSFVTRSNGRIEVESQPGSGATFRIRLPRVTVLKDALQLTEAA